MATANLVYLVKSWEGIKDGNPRTVNLDPYLDPVGIATIGYGHMIYDQDTEKPLRGMTGLKKAASLYPNGISNEQADILLGADLDDLETRIRPGLRNDTAPGEFDSLVSFTFNLGLKALGQSTLLKMHNRKFPLVPIPNGQEAFELAARVRSRKLSKPQNLIEAFAAYSMARGAFFLGLFCRRLSEYALYTGMDGVGAVKIGVDRRAYIQQQVKRR